MAAPLIAGVEMICTHGSRHISKLTCLYGEFLFTIDSDDMAIGPPGIRQGTVTDITGDTGLGRQTRDGERHRAAGGASTADGTVAGKGRRWRTSGSI